MDNIGINAENLRSVLKPMVAMFVAEVNPRSDVLTKSQAYKKYSRRWIDDQIQRGNLSVRYSGSRRFVSKSDVELLIAAEKEQPTLV